MGSNPVIVLSDALWRTEFNADSGIINRLITLDDRQRVVIGVMPSGVDLPTNAQYWVPLAPVLPEPREEFYYSCIARLHGDVSMEAAQNELQMLLSRLDTSRDPEFRNGHAIVMPLHNRQYGSAQKPLMLLFGTVAILLLIACAYIANLTLSHSGSRRREFAVRLALGAARWRLVQQLLIENAILAIIGGAFGALIPFVAVDAFVKYGPSNIAGVRDIHVNATVMIFAAIVTIFVALVCGLTPALAGARSGTSAALKSGSLRVSHSKVSNAYRSILVTLEVAAALTLLTGAGLLTRSFARAIAIDPGFRSEQVFATYFFVPNRTYVEHLHSVSFFERTSSRMRALPGIEVMSLSNTIPLYSISTTQSIKVSANDGAVLVSSNYVDGGFGNTFGLHLISGRFIDSTDREGSTPVMMISATAARIFFSDASPIGRALPFPPKARAGQNPPIVVGVVQDVTQESIEKHPMPQIFYSIAQQGEQPVWLTVRTSMRFADYRKALTKIVNESDPKQDSPDVVDMSRELEKQYAPRRFNSMLINAFSSLALLLAMIGLYGIVAYGVAARSHEIGIRMALGAQHSNVIRLVLRQGLVLTAIGIVLGIVASYALARTLSSMLFEVQVHDAITFLFAPLLLFGIAAIACAVPARRAARVSPMIALRND